MLQNQLCGFWPYIPVNYGQDYLIFLNIMSMLVTIPRNFVVSFVILRSTTLWSQMSFIFIASMSIADFFVGLVGQPLIMIVILNPTIPYIKCVAYGTFWTICSSSGFGVLFITIERYLFIQYPLKYDMIFTRRRTIYVILAQWLVSILFGNIQLVHRHDIFWNTFFLVTLVMINFIMVFLYVLIYRSVSEHKKKIPNPTSFPKNQSNTKIAKSSKYLFAIVMIFCGSWYPPLVVIFLRPMYENNNLILDICLYWALLFGCLNSSINIFIYGLGNKLLRREIISLLHLAMPKRPKSFTFQRRINRVNIFTDSSRCMR